MVRCEMAFADGIAIAANRRERSDAATAEKPRKSSMRSAKEIWAASMRASQKAGLVRN